MRIELTTNAKRKLAQIKGFQISVGHPKNGKRIVREIIKQTKKLGYHPEIGQVEEFLEIENRGHRYLLVDRLYKVVYLIFQNTIYVTDVFDVRQDPSKIRG